MNHCPTVIAHVRYLFGSTVENHFVLNEVKRMPSETQKLYFEKMLMMLHVSFFKTVIYLYHKVSNHIKLIVTCFIK